MDSPYRIVDEELLVWAETGILWSSKSVLDESKGPNSNEAIGMHCVVDKIGGSGNGRLRVRYRLGLKSPKSDMVRISKVCPKDEGSCGFCT